MILPRKVSSYDTTQALRQGYENNPVCQPVRLNIMSLIAFCTSRRSSLESLLKDGYVDMMDVLADIQSTSGIGAK